TAAEAEQAQAPGSTGSPPGPAAAPPPVSERSCAKCGSPMNLAQDWCLQCGAGAPGSLGASTPGWRSGATILIATAVLVLGAAAAGYAALSKGKGASQVRTVAQAAAPTAPGAATTPGATLLPPKTLGAPTTIAPALPRTRVKLPKIPLTAVKPKTIPTTPISPAGGTTTTPATTPSSSETGGSTPEPQPAPILLDTNAAATYNPAAYPASDFGDPSLAIDGDISTAWTAQVEPTIAPKMAAGLVIDLKSARRLSALQLITTTPGMTVQVLGARGQSPPAAITDPAWTALSSTVDVKKRHQKIKLKDSTKAFRFVTLWISRAPAASVGTPQTPGHVSVHELELFPAS
ncbi:MAG TPA: hypothetical protein VES97_08770, partial [Solirubrobacteraceae bacterium]|nr:hypothetical protein [Solirubrobacteraceae bacterium]